MLAWSGEAIATSPNPSRSCIHNSNVPKIATRLRALPRSIRTLLTALKLLCHPIQQLAAQTLELRYRPTHRKTSQHPHEQGHRPPCKRAQPPSVPLIKHRLHTDYIISSCSSDSRSIYVPLSCASRRPYTPLQFQSTSIAIHTEYAVCGDRCGRAYDDGTWCRRWRKAGVSPARNRGMLELDDGS